MRYLIIVCCFVGSIVCSEDKKTPAMVSSSSANRVLNSQPSLTNTSSSNFSNGGLIKGVKPKKSLFTKCIDCTAAAVLCVIGANDEQPPKVDNL